MSIHSGPGTLSPRSNTVEVTTTLFELMEAMDEIAGGTSEARLSGAVGRKADLGQERQVARTIANMFLSGKIRFKHPLNIRKTFPELVD